MAMLRAEFLLTLTLAACSASESDSPGDDDAGSPGVDAAHAHDATTQGADGGHVNDAASGDASHIDTDAGHPVDASVDAPVSKDASADAAKPDAAPPPTRDLTFYVVADTHADPVEEYDLKAQAAAVNAVGNGGTWPATIDGQATHFKGGAIAKPKGVVFVGDLTGWGTAPTEIPMFQHYFQKGNSSESINYNGYFGFGNHDIDTADRDPATADAYRATYWTFLGKQHNGPNAVVPVGRYDTSSHDYSWSWGDVHLVQTNRFVGDSQYGSTSGLPFLADDLKTAAADGRPVFLFHHYGMDAFGTQDRWWTDADRTAYRNELKGYAVSAIFVGHSHAAFQYTWQGIRVFQVNNAKAENGTGNNDGNGSFAIVRITNDQLDIVTCRWTDDQGHYEMISPFFSGPANPGRAQ